MTPLICAVRARAPRRFIGWQAFFDFGKTFTDPNSTNPAIRSNKLLDKLSTPCSTAARRYSCTRRPDLLPQRNLLRHVTWQLPSGQSIAEAMDLPSLSREDLSELKDLGQDLDGSTPLWYYILKEAEVMAGGLSGAGRRPHCGRSHHRPAAARPTCLLSAKPQWRPTLPTRNGEVTGNFRMVDFHLYDTDPTSRGQ